MADTAATVSVTCPGQVDAVIPVDPDKCVVTVPADGPLSVALMEAAADLEVSYDGTTWSAPASTAGLIVWSSRMSKGGITYLRIASGGSQVTRPLLSRDHL
jgi:hypothetical protein